MSHIKDAKKFMSNPVEYHGFNGFTPTYFWSNENIAAYLNLINITGQESALTVLSSGDHAFNLVTAGVTDIDTFDINSFTKYFALGLKKAMLEKYDYANFLECQQLVERMYCNMSKKQSLSFTQRMNEIINDVSPLIDQEYRSFWQKVSDYLTKNSSADFSNLFHKGAILQNPPFYNNYLQSAENYNRLRENLNKANITFQKCDITDLSRTFSKQYDLILLSNILDYISEVWGMNWDYAKLQEFEKSLESIVNNQGVVFLNYIYNYYLGQEQIICGSDISQKDLTDEKYYHIINPDIWHQNHGILLKRYIKKPKNE